MRILWHSVAPWAPTGYGQQTAIWVPRLASLGHDVAISALSGLTGAPIDWNGHRVYPAGRADNGSDVLARHAGHWQADLVITLIDIWSIGPNVLRETGRGRTVACWVPIDCEPLSSGDYLTLASSGAKAIAMSRHGQRMLEDKGIHAPYVPHGIAPAVWQPLTPAARTAARAAMGVADRFVIVVNATNMDGANGRSRKAWPEQIAAFARLHKRHPDAVMFANTIANQDGGVPLHYLAEDYGAADAIRFSDDYEMTAGLRPASELAKLYSLADLYSGATCGEGFGIPLVEAQACGTPAVATDFSAMSEVCGGWLVPGQEHYIPGHRAHWRVPSVDHLARVYETAYGRGPKYQAKKTRARDHALSYDADQVLTQHWKPALEELEPTPARR